MNKDKNKVFIPLLKPLAYPAMFVAMFSALVGLAYLITVFITYVIQLLVNAVFATAYDYNIWLMASLIWTIMFALNLLRK